MLYLWSFFFNSCNILSFCIFCVRSSSRHFSRLLSFSSLTFSRNSLSCCCSKSMISVQMSDWSCFNLFTLGSSMFLRFSSFDDGIFGNFVGIGIASVTLFCNKGTCMTGAGGSSLICCWALSLHSITILRKSSSESSLLDNEGSCTMLEGCGVGGGGRDYSQLINNSNSNTKIIPISYQLDDLFFYLSWLDA